MHATMSANFWNVAGNKSQKIFPWIWQPVYNNSRTQKQLSEKEKQNMYGFSQTKCACNYKTLTITLLLMTRTHTVGT